MNKPHSFFIGMWDPERYPLKDDEIIKTSVTTDKRWDSSFEVVDAAAYDALLERAASMAEALQWSKEMFVARDEMNAKAHCAPVRLSPITERVSMALSSWQKFKEQL